MDSLISVSLRSCSFEITVPAKSANWHLDGVGGGKESLSTAIFQSAILAADVVVEIGSRIGYYSCLAASSNPKARVIAVDACQQNLEAIKANAALNSLRIETYLESFDNNLSNESERSHRTNHADYSGTLSNLTSPLVDLTKKESMSGYNFFIEAGQKLVVKVDVEGNELLALKKLERVLDEASDTCLLVKFNPSFIQEARGNPNALLNWLRESQYRVFALNESGFSWLEVFDDSFLGLTENDNFNLWCVPAATSLTVCAILHSAALAGAERDHVEAVEDLISSGFMVHTIMPEPNAGLVEELHDVGSSTSLLPAYPWWIVRKDHPDPALADRNWRENLFSAQMLREIEAINPDVVLTQTIAIPQGAFAALALGKPHIWWIQEFSDRDHDLRLPLPPELTGEVVASLSNVVLTVSSAVRDHFFPSNPGAATVIYPSPRIASSINFGAREGHQFTVGIIANLQPGKGHSDALHAIAELKADGYSVRLNCIGAASPDNIERLQLIANNLGVNDLLTFSGFIADRSIIYGLIDAVAITSRAEAFGRVPFEAAAGGIPVLYARSGGPVEYMVEGTTGLAYTPGESHGLAIAIRQLVENPELGPRLVSNSRTHFRNLQNDPNRVPRLAGAFREAYSTFHSKPLQTQGAFPDCMFRLSHTVLAERDAVLAERDAVLAERDAIITSRTWRYSSWFRGLRVF